MVLVSLCVIVAILFATFIAVCAIRGTGQHPERSRPDADPRIPIRKIQPVHHEEGN